MLFHRAIEQADKAEDVQGRISILMEDITYAVFLYTNQALLERDKLTFLSQMAFQVRKLVTLKHPQSQNPIPLSISCFTSTERRNDTFLRSLWWPEVRMNLPE